MSVIDYERFNDYFLHQKAVDNEFFYITENPPGLRLICIVNEDGKIESYYPHEYNFSLPSQIESSLKGVYENWGFGFVFDGFIVYPSTTLNASERFDLLIRSLMTGEDKDLEYIVFDVLDVDAFREKNCDIPYYMRRQKAVTLFSDFNNVTHIKELPILYQGKDKDQIKILYGLDKDSHTFGLLIFLTERRYSFTRSNNVLVVDDSGKIYDDQ